MGGGRGTLEPSKTLWFLGVDQRPSNVNLRCGPLGCQEDPVSISTLVRLAGSSVSLARALQDPLSLLQPSSRHLGDRGNVQILGNDSYHRLDHTGHTEWECSESYITLASFPRNRP